MSVFLPTRMWLQELQHVHYFYYVFLIYTFTIVIIHKNVVGTIQASSPDTTHLFALRLEGKKKDIISPFF